MITLNKAQAETAAALDTNPKYIDKVKAIFHENISTLESKKLLDAAGSNINLIQEKYKLSKECSSINNIVGWILSAIKEDFKESQSKVNTGTFGDYEQRSYDFDKLEKELLGWSR